MADHNLPQLTSTYSDFLSMLDARLDDLAMGLSNTATTATNLPTNSVRWNSSNKYWEINTGTAAAPVWGALSSAYNININGTVGATTPASGAFTTLSTSGVAALATGSTVGGNAIITTTAAQTLSSKTFTTPRINDSSSTHTYLFGVSELAADRTITLPLLSSNDTFVFEGHIQTLSNKTLTAPKFASSGYLADANGNELITFSATVSSAVNDIKITNAATGVSPSIEANGGDTNIDLVLKGKGTGVVKSGGTGATNQVVTIGGTETLTNKTLTAPAISSISNSGTITIPTGTDTLVGRATTDTLSNKTLTAPKFADLGYIADANGNEMLEFDSVASAANYVTLTNAATTGSPSISANGSDTNIGLVVAAKGTGLVYVGSAVAANEIVTLGNTKTLTNKTLTTPKISDSDSTNTYNILGSNLAADRSITLPLLTGDDTFVFQAHTQTLTNKTIGSAGASATWDGNTIAINRGGTGTTTAPTQYGVIYAGSTTAYASTAAGTAGQLLTANASAAPTWQSFDLSIHAPDASFKKSVRVATTDNLEASTFSSNVLTGYSNTLSLNVSTTSASTTATTTSTAGIKVGAVISGNANIPVGTTVASISNATTFILSAAATATASSIATTFTQNISQLAIDGVSLAVNDRVLVKDQTYFAGLQPTDVAKYNGIYYVTAVGSTTTPWTLTRAPDADASTDLDGALVSVAAGTTNASRIYKISGFSASSTLNTTPQYWDRMLDTSGSAFYTSPGTGVGVDINTDTKSITLASTGTTADLAINTLGRKTLNAQAASTYTRSSTLYIPGAPIAGTNVTITNPYAIYVAQGDVYMAGTLSTGSTVNGLSLSSGGISTGAATASALFSTTTTGNVAIAGGLTTGTFTIGSTSSTGTASLFPATGAQNINIGTATTGTVTIGSTSATAVQLPTGKTKIGTTTLIQGGSVDITLPTSAGTLARLADTLYVGTTAITLNRASASQTLTGVNVDGNAGTATVLATARNINGTSFNGSANITTATWGTSRTLTIGSTGKAIDGSANVSWTLAEIGAQASGNYAVTGDTTPADTYLYVARTGTNTPLYVRHGGTSGNIANFFASTTAGATSGDSQVSIGFDGSITASGSITAYSDIRLKSDLAVITNALDKVSKLTGYIYTRNDTGQRNTGLVAQDVQKVLPEAVVEGEYLSVAYGNLLGLIVEAVKELKYRLDTMEAK